MDEQEQPRGALAAACLHLVSDFDGNQMALWDCRGAGG